MEWFKKLFNNVKSFFTKLFGNNASEFIVLLEQVSPLVNRALPVVRQIALLTPNKTDDAIVKAYDSLGFPGLFTPGSDKSVALRDLAKKVIIATNPDPVSDYLANTAVELAYAKYKQESTAKN